MEGKEIPLIKRLKLRRTNEDRINREATFGMSTVNLKHGKIYVGSKIRGFHTKITHVVKNPAPGLLEIALRRGLVATRDRQLEADWLQVPPVDMFHVSGSSSKLVGRRLAEVEPEI